MYLWSSHPEVVSRLAAVAAAAISRAAVRVSVAARSMGRAVDVSRRWCGVACLACCGGWLRSVLCRDVWRSCGFGCEKVSLVCWCCDLRAWVVRACGFLHAARGGAFVLLCAVRVGLRPFWCVCAWPKVFLFAAAVGAPPGIGRRI